MVDRMGVHYRTHQPPGLARFVPYRSLLTPAVLYTRDGDLIGSWRLRGIDCTAADANTLGQCHEAWCQLTQAAAKARVGFWMHRIRRRLAHHPKTREVSKVTALDLIDEAHERGLAQAGLYLTELYLSAVLRPAHGRRPSLGEQGLRAELAEFDQFADFLEAALAGFGPQRLTLEEQNAGARHSAQLRFYGFLLNAIDEPMPVPYGPIAPALATSRLIFDGAHLSAQGALSASSALILDLKEYPSVTTPGMLDGCLNLSCDLIETQSFLPLGRSEAQRYLERQRNQLISSADGSRSQIAEIALAIDGVASQDFVLGEYHYSVAALAPTRRETSTAIAALRTRLNDAGFQSTLVDLVPDLAWFAQLPGNWRYRPRSARLSSRNFCALAPLHGHAGGKASGNPWGDSVVRLAGVNQSAVHFNFHVSRFDHDATGDKAPGNTLIIGQTGSGKTVLELFLISQALKFAPRLVLFDKDRSSEIALRAFGARYTVFESGAATGINPLAWPATPENYAFMQRWLVTLAAGAEPLPGPALEALSDALDTLVTFPIAQRTLSVLLQNLPLNESALCAGLKRWCGKAPYGWVFDQPHPVHPAGEPKDSAATRVGYDLTAFFAQPEILTPVMMALLHQLEEWLDGQPLIYVITECWKALDDGQFSAFVRDKQKTIRKQNGLGIFDTQSPRDLLNNRHASALIEQTATLILLPNPLCSETDYCQGLKCTPSEFRLLQSLTPGDRRFLIKQGNQCTVATLDFSASPEILLLLSANTETVHLLDQIRQQVGDQFSDWWPVLRDAVERRQRQRPSPDQ